MREIYAAGETVYDLIFKDNKIVAAKAGGSMLNAAISMGRLRLPVNFISEFGKDKIGDIISEFLKDNRVNDELVYKYDGKTPLSLAFLNIDSDAEYSFYRLFPKKRFEIRFPNIKINDIFIFGSFFSITQEIRPRLFDLISFAKKNGALIIYDPNFRSSHLHQLGELKDLIIENISLSDIIRGSDEDFKNIFGSQDADEAYREVTKYGCKNLVYTANNKGVTLRTTGIRKHYKVNDIKPLSTIGAGDNFNAGIVHSLYKQNISLSDLQRLDEEKWDKMIETGIKLGTYVCMSFDNYISEKFASEL